MNVPDDIARQDTPMIRKAVTPNCRPAITLYYLASLYGYRTVANFISGVSSSFVCTRIHGVREAKARRAASVIGDPTPQNIFSAHGPPFRQARTTSGGGSAPPDFFGPRAKKFASTRQKNQVGRPQSNGPRDHL